MLLTRFHIYHSITEFSLQEIFFSSFHFILILFYVFVNFLSIFMPTILLYFIILIMYCFLCAFFFFLLLFFRSPSAVSFNPFIYRHAKIFTLFLFLCVLSLFLFCLIDVNTKEKCGILFCVHNVHWYLCSLFLLFPWLLLLLLLLLLLFCFFLCSFLCF